MIVLTKLLKMDWIKKLFGLRKARSASKQLAADPEGEIRDQNQPRHTPDIFLSIWRYLHRELFADSEIDLADAADLDLLMASANAEMRVMIDQGQVTAEEMIRSLLNFVQSNNEDELKKRNERVLLEAVDILVSYKSPDRNLFRRVLWESFRLTKYIDRSILYVDRPPQGDGNQEPATLCNTHVAEQRARERRDYVLEKVAGWRVDREDPVWDIPACVKYYLELPFQRKGTRLGHTQVLAEALYRFQDPELVLALLRHGATPSCIYLWPISIMLDFKYSLSDSAEDSGTDSEDGENPNPRRQDALSDKLRDSTEAIIIRYFCWARRHFVLHVVSPEEDGPETRLPLGVCYDDILLLPPDAQSLIPDDRYKSPAPLMHQCRLIIRQTLLEGDNLPRGIHRLQLPTLMKAYLDLLADS